MILNARARRHAWSGQGSLSLKSFGEGSAVYEVGRGRFRVDPGEYLLVNADQPYSVEIDSPTPVSSLCLFFRPGFVEDVHRSLTSGLPSLLDDPASSAPISFFERTYRRTAVLDRMLAQVKDSHSVSGDLDSGMYRVARVLLSERSCLEREIARIPAARRSTREELYRRLHVAREFIDSSFERRMTLIDIAQVACLSPNHLLRSYGSLFGHTPHQALTKRRLLAAASLLTQSEMTVTQICYEVGFESLGSFSALFTRSFGVSPRGFRKAKQAGFGDFREVTQARGI